MNNLDLHSSMVRLEMHGEGNPKDKNRHLHSSMVRLEI